MTVRDHTGAGVVVQSQTPRRLISDRRPDELHTAEWNPARGNLLNHLFFSLRLPSQVIRRAVGTAWTLRAAGASPGSR